MRAESISEMQQLAADFLGNLKPSKDAATVIGLSGELGSGKTTFVQCVARTLGVTEPVTSPTFVLLKTYPLQHDDFKTLVHVDAYRLESGEELKQMDWQKYINNRENLIFVEWPEHVQDALSSETQTLTFTFINETTREVRG